MVFGFKRNHVAGIPLNRMDFFRHRINVVLAEQLPKAKSNKRGVPWTLSDARETEHTFDFAYMVPAEKYAGHHVYKVLDQIMASCGTWVDVLDLGGVVVFTVYKKDFPAKLKFDDEMLGIAGPGRKVYLGTDRRGRPLIHSFDENPHCLVSGMSGYGKTDIIRWILLNLVDRFGPESLEIYIIDMKGGISFMPFERLPHVKEVVTTLEGAGRLLEHSYYLMEERLQFVRMVGNRRVMKHFKWRIILIDEGSEIAPGLMIDRNDKKRAMHAARYAGKIAAKGREPSVSLLYCTQYPTAEVVLPQIKANFSNVVTFRVESAGHSRVSLGKDGAEEITEIGRAIYKSRNGYTMFQAPYVGSDDVWDRVLAPYEFVTDGVMDGEWSWVDDATEDGAGAGCVQTPSPSLYLPF